jgi:hypothetical protein
MAGEEIGFSSALGKRAPYMGFLPANLVSAWGPIVGTVSVAAWAAAQMGVPITPISYAATTAALCGTEWILAGDKPWRWWGKFRKGKRRAKAGLRFEPTDKALKPSVPARTIKKKTYLAIENVSALETYVEFRLRGRKVGAYLLRKGNAFKVVFAFSCKGFGSSIYPEDALKICEYLQEGLKSLTTTESITFEMSTRSDCGDRLDQLQTLIDSDIQPELKYLLKWDQERAKGLTRINRHNPKRLTIYYTYSVGAGAKKADDPIESFLYTLSDTFKEWFSKPNDRKLRDRLHDLLKNAYLQGFSGAEDYLSERLSLPVKALKAQDIWRIDWERFNKGSCPEVPHLLVLNKEGLKLEGRGNAHAASKLHPAAPVEHKSYVYIPGRKKYVGVAVLDGKPNRRWKKDDPESRLNQLMFGSNALNHPKMPDTTITVQFTGQNQRDALKNAEGLARSGQRDARLASLKGKLDQNAEHRKSKAIDADWILREGGVTARVAWVAQIERDSLEELDRAMHTFCTLSDFTGGIVTREVEYAMDIWHQTMPYAWGKLLKDPWDRRIEDTTHALMCFIPLIYDRMKDNCGVEYISQRGYTPVFSNPFCPNPHGHMIKLGKTGSGKSVEEIGSIIMALAMGGNVIIVDATRGDGTGTFDPIVEFVGGSYYNTMRDSYNLFQGADFRKLSDDTNEGKEESARSIAQKLFRKFLVDAMKDLALGDDPDKTKERQYKQVLAILIEQFLSRQDIQERYDAAFDGGFGSDAWQAFPTLKDFYAYLNPENLPEMVRNDDTEQTIKEIALSIGAILARPIGEAISRPSTFRSESKFTVVALAGLSGNDDAKPLALAAASFVLASSLDNDRTLFIGDESSYLSAFEAYMQIVAGFFSGGRKMGIWCHLLGQNDKGIQASPFAEDIYSNVATYFAGKVSSKVAASLEAHGVPAHLLKRNISEDEDDDHQDALTEWIYSQPEEGRHCAVFFPPSFAHLALAVNGKPELRLRKQFNEMFPNDKYAANAAFAKHLREQSTEALADF